MQPIPFSRPALEQEDKDAVLRVLDSGWLTTGRETLSFEREFADFIGAGHALAVNSATAGLHLALEAAGIGPGDLVFTTPYTFTATAEVVRYVGAEIVFVDIDRDSGLMNPDLLEHGLRKARRERGEHRPAAVIPVHLAGLPCDMDAITRICTENDIFLLEDAAHSLPSRTKRGYAGTIGDAGVFSFYATKPITTGEGGMVCTDSDVLAERISTMRLHGIDREAWQRYSTPGASWYYEVVAAGFKYNMPDISAAIGRVQLQRAQELHDRRRSIARRYLEALSDCDFCTLPRDADSHAWHLFSIEFDTGRLETTREAIIGAYTKAGIGTSVHYIPLHVMPYYAKRYALRPEDFPESLYRFERTVSIPLFPSLTDGEIDRIIETTLALPRLIPRNLLK